MLRPTCRLGCATRAGIFPKSIEFKVYGAHKISFISLGQHAAAKFTSVQATHFVDLMRYLVDDIDKDSILAMAVGPKQMILEDMAKPPEAEHPVSKAPLRLSTS